MDQTAFAGALKTLYSPDQVENLTYRDNPLHALLEKDTEFYGDSFKEALVWGNPQGRGHTVANAQARKAASKISGFVLTRVSDYFTASVANETIEASKNDKGAFLRALETEINGGMRELTRSISIAEYGDGSGVRGLVGTYTSGDPSIVLGDIEQITNFAVDMNVVVLNGSTNAYRGTFTIAAIDRDTGKITMSGTVASTAANDKLVVGTGDSSGTLYDFNAEISGLRAWLPDTAPGATAFFGVNRSLDVVRLGGIRSDQSTVSLDEGLINAAAQGGREGASSDYCFLDFLQWKNLVKILGAQVRYIKPYDTADFGFQYVEIIGPKGVIKVVADRNAPSTRAFMLQMNTWKLRSLGMVPRLLDSDGNQVLREAAADNVEVRLGYRAQLGCSAPGWNINIKLA